MVDYVFLLYGYKPAKRTTDNPTFDREIKVPCQIWTAGVKTAKDLTGSYDARIFSIELMVWVEPQDFVSVDGAICRIIFKDKDQDLIYAQVVD